MGIEGIISQQFFWCFWASQTLYNGKTLEPELQTQFEYFWITLCVSVDTQFDFDRQHSQFHLILEPPKGPSTILISLD